MALISCPECGKEISDKVKACPHCGYPFENQDVSDIEKDPQPVAVTSISLGKSNPAKKKKVLITITAIFVIAIITIVTAFNIHKNNEKNSRNQYIDMLSAVQSTMLTGASDAETLGNLAHSVWYNTIFEKTDSETDKYTRVGGTYGFNSDFNVSLQSLYSDQTTKDSISKIKANQDTVSEMMRKLQNPDEEFKLCFSTATDMYKAYQSITDLVCSPTGNLESFTQNFNKADSDFMQQYKTLDSQIPEKSK